ncbi:glycoside hydrolase family 130 protein [Novosphingobium humi]|uniref:Glycoside hydrolase family 130 protein n=1 Tax=Novosphingobium humi TaxID=2282397 RepID=A0ABY7U6J1_9SPHN|nr:glycoside hydrolase family 130 protein [Novosphingobium humi]WCT80034.1 glycoside hydrolase family 130 protein [Novosphingobium humi]WJS97250.1 glycoside hydrolase family 130 protein [Novosphingobium humi]
MQDFPFFNRHALHLRPDPSRVVVRPFRLAIEPREFNPTDKARVNHIVERVLALDEAETEAVLANTLRNFDHHDYMLGIFEQRARDMEHVFASHASFSLAQRQLIGAYFLHEYSFEAAALFNPSIVPHPDQSGVAHGGLRFILSLRAVGEGHVSSLTFRCGTISQEGMLAIEPPLRFASLPKVTARVGDRIELTFADDSDITERVIFPVTEAQVNGIEDARFVAFEEEGCTAYYATYTAYSGREIRSELLETRDFLSFRLVALRGLAAGNKGMALFPRKLGGRYAMIARHDNESLHLIYSDNLLEWDLGTPILRPKFPWEFIQIGNCGSPIELDEGWLLFTHGVGPMRHYSIGAMLLDKDDPSRVIGRSHVPLVQPEKSEREGYVPNVVYSCGAMKFGDRIVLPYAISDTFSTLATVKIATLVELLTQGGAADGT